MQAIEICRNPVFIIGSPRSGTSILARSLSRHSDLWYSIEGQIFDRLFSDRRLDEVYAYGSARSWSWIRREHVGREEFIEAAGLGLNALYTSRSKGKRWIEKTPGNTLVASLLADMFPTATFIHILRDGRLVVNSIIHYPRSRNWGKDFRAACREWKDHVAMAADFIQLYSGRCLTVRHSDLRAAPEQEFGKIFRFLDIPDEDAPAEYVRSTTINSSFGPDFAAPDFHNRPDPWDEWTVEQKRIFLDEAGEAMLQWQLLTEDELRLMEVRTRAP